jgi:hypothetical protein
MLSKISGATSVLIGRRDALSGELLQIQTVTPSDIKKQCKVEPQIMDEFFGSFSEWLRESAGMLSTGQCVQLRCTAELGGRVHVAKLPVEVRYFGEAREIAEVLMSRQEKEATTADTPRDDSNFGSGKTCRPVVPVQLNTSKSQAER